MSSVGAAGSAGLVHTVIDQLAAEFAEDPWRAEITAAREHFFTQAGKVFEDDDELYEARLAAFLEWYVLDRPLADGPPPVLRVLAAPGARAAGEVTALAYLAASRRSLFEVDAVDGSRLLIEDLMGGARFLVSERRGTIGFEPGDLLEARLVFDGDQVIFGKTFLFHPRDAHAEVLKLVDTALGRGGRPDDVLFELSRLHVRWFRLNHVGAARIYRGGG